MRKSELLRFADKLDEAAKNEEIRYVTIRDLPFGQVRTFSHYEIPYVAEGLRKQAALMAG